MTVYKFCSYNVRGLRNCKKRRKLFAYFHRNNYDFIFLQESHSTLQDQIIWSNEWGGKAFFAHGTVFSKGVSILLKPSVSVDPAKVVCDNDGRFVILCVKVCNVNLLLINIYGHNLDRVDLFTSIEAHISNYDWDVIIWGGDFNLVLNLQEDKIGGLPQTNFNARAKLLSLIENHDLLDIWRDRNPKSKTFTWHSSIDPSIHCRLDFFLISRQLKHSVTDCSITSVFGSDHASVSLALQLGVERGKGMWKLNSSLLDDSSYIELISRTIADTVNSCHDQNPSLLWETCKLNIRSASITYSSYLSHQRRLYERSLLKRISNLEHQFSLNPSSVNSIYLNYARAALEALYDQKLKGIILRSRARWSELGEKNTKYFLNLEKRNRMLSSINELILENNLVTHDFQVIMKETRRFYQNLYTKDQNVSSNDFFHNVQLNHNVLSIDQQNSCEGLFTLDEFSRSLFSMSVGKSPGSDGIPTAFYKVFWDKVGPLVVNSFNHAYHRGYISDEQGRACITLIPKPNKDHRFLKNWRPIALLNTDY
ncbi:hypothetical protein HOLleu_17256 [Holothuria leucospilota]|uniref:Endonuclease/exonuclease/phosphatase domain-containing protein n=1 Tax=Holothuria leucospilota TaxID=206669 RepID=A0A9Q1HB58_HOLLE|nr:hypothetical protein HOLleu_17256 [Holothuria leucospilota]